MLEWAQQRVESLGPASVLALLVVAPGALYLILAGHLLLLSILAVSAAGSCGAWVMRGRADAHREELIAALLEVLRQAHEPTFRHAMRTVTLSDWVADAIRFSPARRRALRQAVILHDIGKLGTDVHVLDKAGALEDSEYEHVKRHAEAGAEILAAAPSLRSLSPFVRAHHERMDGGGYPLGIPAAEAPLESRIIAVVDAFDAMVVDDGVGRNYREPLTVTEALDELRRCAGSQFDPEVVDVFCKVVRTGGMC